MKLHLQAEKVTAKELQEAYEIARIIFEGRTCKLIFHNASGDIIYQENLTEQMLKRKEVEKN